MTRYYLCELDVEEGLRDQQRRRCAHDEFAVRNAANSIPRLTESARPSISGRGGVYYAIFGEVPRIAACSVTIPMATSITAFIPATDCGRGIRGRRLAEGGNRNSPHRGRHPHGDIGDPAHADLEEAGVATGTFRSRGCRIRPLHRRAQRSSVDDPLQRSSGSAATRRCGGAGEAPSTPSRSTPISTYGPWRPRSRTASGGFRTMPAWGWPLCRCHQRDRCRSRRYSGLAGRRHRCAPSDRAS